jgi:hypothetical protein
MIATGEGRSLAVSAFALGSCRRARVPDACHFHDARGKSQWARAFRDYAGAEQISAVWRAVAGVVADARPTSVHERDGERIAFFAGTIKAQPVDGVLRTLTNDEHLVIDITLTIRPWAALKAGLADIKL